MAPMDWPWRSLKFAIDLRALVMTGFWPVSCPSCSTEASMILPLLMASPRPMLTTTFSSLGTCIGFLNPSSFTSAGRISFSNRSFNRAAMCSAPCLRPAPALAGRCGFVVVRRMHSGRGGGQAPALLRLLLAARLLLRAVLANALLLADGLVGLADQHHARDGDRAVLLDDAALRARLAAALLEVPLHHRHLVDPDAGLLAQDLEHLAGLALVLAGHDLHQVVLADLHGYSTSGASEMIFMNLRARSSRATGPKMRVPIGSRSLLMRTAELPSNRM